MKRGEFIKGYRILEDPKMTNAGHCFWTFAEHGDKQYFIKQFLSPKYPTEGAPGSAKVKENMKRLCQAFEAHQRKVLDVLAGKSMEGGNLIVPRDFFREGPIYYKVTEKIDVSNLSIEEIAQLRFFDRMVIIKTIAFSLRILHRERIVHGDLKPTNILIKQTPAGGYAAKLIDFDSSYFAKEPPDFDSIVGDMVYFAPEVVAYLAKPEDTKRHQLSLPSDIFALGLIFHQYLTGVLPTWTTSHAYAHEALLDGKSLTVNATELPKGASALLESMLKRAPGERPDINSVIASLASIKVDDNPVKKSGLRVSVNMSTSAHSSPEYVSDKDKNTETRTPTGTASSSGPEVRRSKLKGTLVKRD